MGVATNFSTRTSSSIKQTNRSHAPLDQVQTAMNEADSNADTCCLGKNWIILQHTSRSADVYPYDEAMTPVKNVPIVSGATAYTDESGTTFILVINEALYYGDKLNHSLINPNQIRNNDIDFWDNPYDRDRQLKIDIPDT